MSEIFTLSFTEGNLSLVGTLKESVSQIPPMRIREWRETQEKRGETQEKTENRNVILLLRMRKKDYSNIGAKRKSV